MKKTIILTGGGTAGHIMPNLALLPEISKHYDKIYYLGAKDGLEEKILKDYPNIKFISIPTVKLIRAVTLKNLLIPFKLLNGIRKTKKIIKEIKPNIIFSKGGFVAVPVCIAGKKCKVPVVSHESDLSFGLANKIILKFAKCVCTSFETTAQLSKKCIYTGSPIREEILKGRAENVFANGNFDRSKPTVLFFGGSLGAKKINDAVVASYDQLLAKYNILHITGKGNQTDIRAKGYYQIEFTNKIADFFACADLVVCRGGANSLFELLALKKPMLIIPLGKAESRGDQIENAKYFTQKGYALSLNEDSLSSQNLLLALTNLQNSASKIISNMPKNQDSNKKIVEIINRFAKG